MSQTELPIRLTSFVGRAAELHTLAELLRQERLVTLTGSGGAGKTRLALRASTDFARLTGSNVWWVELAPLSDPERVVHEIAIAVGALLATGIEGVQSISEHVSRKPGLLVLDNCEHLQSATADVVDQLLRRSPTLTILATSRVPLDVPGELTWRIPPLGTPGLNGDAHGQVTLDGLHHFDAIELFVDRARHARSTFVLGTENLAAVAAICRKLDGIPLAIELAAARINFLLPTQILQGLDDALRLLTNGSRLAIPRHRTLEASMRWSWDLLTDREQHMACCLSVFRGSFDLQAAEAVCTVDGRAPDEVVDLLESLIDHSMVVFVEPSGRFRVLETVRQYAYGQFDNQEVAHRCEGNHAKYFESLVKAVVPRCETSDQFKAVAELELERDNILAALQWFRATKDRAALSELVCALGRFWTIGGDRSEGMLWTSRAMELLENEQTAAHARLHAHRAEWFIGFGKPQDSLQEAAEAIRMGKEVGDLLAVGRANATLTTLFAFGARDLWQRQWSKSVQILSQTDDSLALATLQIWGAVPLLVVGQTVEGLAALEKARPVVVATGQPWVLATLSVWEALGLIHSGRPAEAETVLEKVVADNALRSAHRVSGALTLLDVCKGWRGSRRSEKSLDDELSQARQDGESFAAEVYSLVGALASLRKNPSETRARIDAWLAGNAIDAALTKTPGLLIGASAAFLAGDLEDAALRSNKIIRWATDQSEVLYRHRALVVSAAVELERGEVTRAESFLHEAIGAHIRFGNLIAVPEALDVLTAVVAQSGNAVKTARLLGAAYSLREKMGTAPGPPFDILTTKARESAQFRLGPDRFESAFVDGKSMDLDATLAYIERTRGKRERPTMGWASLTPTELQVAALVRDGLTNKEIAHRLMMGTETVKTHLSHIFTKLNFSKRTQLTAAVISHMHTDKRP